MEEISNNYKKEKEKYQGQLGDANKTILDLQLTITNLLNEKERLTKSHQDRLQEIEIMNIRHTTIMNQKEEVNIKKY